MNYTKLEEIKTVNLVFLDGKKASRLLSFGRRSAPVSRHLTQMLHAPFNPAINVA
jgi:hypothetical protein